MSSMKELLKLITCGIFGHEVFPPDTYHLFDGEEGKLIICARCTYLRHPKDFAIFKHDSITPHKINNPSL